MLTIGLLTEAVIFFFSAFEPLHEEVDWSLVYPELAGIPEDETPELASHGGKYHGGGGGGGGYGGGAGSVALAKFDEMLEKAEIITRSIPETWCRNEKTQRINSQHECYGRCFCSFNKIYEYN